MRFCKLSFLVVIGVFFITGKSWAAILTYSSHPTFYAGEENLGKVPVIMYDARSIPGTSHGNPIPYWQEYPGEPKTTFTADDLVYLGIGIDLFSLTEEDMVLDSVNGEKYFPRVWWQVWAPGVSTTEQPTWEYRETTFSTSWDEIQEFTADYSFLKHWAGGIWSYYPSSPGEGDLWSVAGGFKEGQWSYRFSIELPTAETDPWATILDDGSLYITSGDITSWLGLANAPVSGSASAVPEPASLFLLGAGVAGLLLKKK